ncbi:MAG: mandelate racemase/muconate lactonizing enzyme family protein [Planctomycetota bacterium]|jgi:L-alanine-DL-glutamate epimerase-like enolase superfamily enzyme
MNQENRPKRTSAHDNRNRLTRRRFLAVSAAASLGPSAAGARGGSPQVKIARIEVFPVRYPTVGYFKFFQGPQGAYGRSAVIVKMTADDGTVGWGQSVPIVTWSYETLETATIAVGDYLAPTLVGRDPLDVAGAHEAMDRGLAPSFTTAMPIARAGLDLALHDLAGRLTGKSLAAMWGKPRGGPLTLSWTLNPRTLDEADALIEAGRKQGYRHFNIKVAPDPKFDVELARRVRRIVPDGFLWADANGGYDPAGALRVAPKLADAGVDVLEAPLRPNRIRAYQALKKQGALPILMDEGVVSPVELEEFIRLKMLDGVAMKASRTGGLFSAKRQIEILTDAGLMWLGSGLCDPDISLAANLALYGAFGLEKPAALNGPQFLAADVLLHFLKKRVLAGGFV